MPTEDITLTATDSSGEVLGEMVITVDVNTTTSIDLSAGNST